MDFGILAHSVITVIAPYLPYVLTAGGKAAEGALKKAGEDAWGKAKTLWSKLGPSIENDPAAVAMAQKVAASPDDQRAQSALEIYIEEILRNDVALADEVARLLNAGGSFNQVIAAGKGSVAAGRDMTGNTIVTGGGLHVKGDGNAFGMNNTTNVLKTTTSQGATLDDFKTLLAQIKETLTAAQIDDKVRRAILADVEAVEAETKDSQPSLPIIGSKLNSIASIARAAAGLGAAAATLLPLVQKAIEYAPLLFS